MLSALVLKRQPLAGVNVGTASAAGKLEPEGEGTFGLNEEYPRVGCLAAFQLIGRGISGSTIRS